MPASTAASSGSSSTRMNDTSDSSRSRCSSMSRFTKVTGRATFAAPYTSRSRSQICSTECSNANGSRFATIAEIFNDT